MQFIQQGQLLVRRRGVIVPDPPGIGTWSNSVLQLHFNGADGSTTFTDSSPNGLTPSVVGGQAQIDTDFAKYGGASLLLDGSGDDYLQYAHNAVFNLTDQPFTMEVWAKGINTSTRTLFSKWSGADGRRSFAWSLSNDDTIFAYTTNGSTQITQSKAGAAFNDGNFHHHAVCRDGSGDLRLFVDGVQYGTTAALGSTSIATTDGPVRIGILGDSVNGAGVVGSTNWGGSLDDFRFTTEALYTANFTPPGPHPDS